MSSPFNASRLWTAILEFAKASGGDPESIMRANKATDEISTALGVGLSFGRALRALKLGQKVAREGWNGKGMWLALQLPDDNSKMQRPYIYMSDAEGLLVPWLASQTDLLSDDWMVVQ